MPATWIGGGHYCWRVLQIISMRTEHINNCNVFTSVVNFTYEVK